MSDIDLGKFSSLLFQIFIFFLSLFPVLQKFSLCLRYIFCSCSTVLEYSFFFFVFCIGFSVCFLYFTDSVVVLERFSSSEILSSTVSSLLISPSKVFFISVRVFLFFPQVFLYFSLTFSFCDYTAHSLLFDVYFSHWNT